MRYRVSRKITGEICQVTVSLRAGTWFVSVETEAEIEDPVHASSSIVGIDLGVARLATLSDGTIFEAENHHRKAAARLAAAQRRMSRRRKFSRNWKKAKARVQRIQARIARTRHDGLHKASTQISKSHAVIVVEDLKIKNMTGSAAGTVENPGQNVRAKARLNKAILDQGWSRFIGMLEYKQAWRGGWVIAVDPRNTSRTCPSCEHVAAENRKTQAKFACVACGFEDNADLVAARNILRAGHARLACGETSLVRASAQEPTKVTPGLAA